MKLVLLFFIRFYMALYKFFHWSNHLLQICLYKYLMLFVRYYELTFSNTLSNESSFLLVGLILIVQFKLTSQAEKTNVTTGLDEGGSHRLLSCYCRGRRYFNCYVTFLQI